MTDPSPDLNRWSAVSERVVEAWLSRDLTRSAELIGAVTDGASEPARSLARAVQILHEQGGSPDPEHEVEIRRCVDVAAKGTSDAHVLLASALIMLDVGDVKSAALYGRRLSPVHEDLTHPEDRASLAHLFGRVAMAVDDLELAKKQFRHAAELAPRAKEHAAALRLVVDMTTGAGQATSTSSGKRRS